MKSYLMKNPSNGEDTNNCTILSLSLAANIPYKEANEIGIKAGRKINEGFYLEPLYKEARKKGIKIKKVPIKSKINLKQFVSNYFFGRFVLANDDHAFCLINGKIHDVKENESNSIIESAYQFEVDSLKKIKEYFKDHYFY